MKDREADAPQQESPLREALSAAVPWLFEYGAHQNPHCYQGSDDGCYCGLDEAQKLVEKALERAALRGYEAQADEVIPGIAGVSPCAGCGKGMDGAFEHVQKVGGNWYHVQCIPADAPHSRGPL
jgi:hypothetical protein